MDRRSERHLHDLEEDEMDEGDENCKYLETVMKLHFMRDRPICQQEITQNMSCGTKLLK